MLLPSGTQLFLVVYVDDFKLAGPTDKLATGWELIRSCISTDPPEKLDLYFGLQTRGIRTYPPRYWYPGTRDGVQHGGVSPVHRGTVPESSRGQCQTQTRSNTIHTRTPIGKPRWSPNEIVINEMSISFIGLDRFPEAFEILFANCFRVLLMSSYSLIEMPILGLIAIRIFLLPIHLLIIHRSVMQ